MATLAGVAGATGAACLTDTALAAGAACLTGYWTTGFTGAACLIGAAGAFGAAISVFFSAFTYDSTEKSWILPTRLVFDAVLAWASAAPSFFGAGGWTHTFSAVFYWATAGFMAVIFGSYTWANGAVLWRFNTDF